MTVVVYIQLIALVASLITAHRQIDTQKTPACTLSPLAPAEAYMWARIHWCIGADVGVERGTAVRPVG